MQKFKLKPAVVVSLVVVVIAGAAAAFFFLSSSPTSPKGPALAAPKPALTVSTAAPQQARLPITLAANGNIAAWQEALIGSESSGLRLTEVRVNVGDSVKAGQVLATFAGDSVQADVAQARAGLMEARANALDAVANGDRARTLQNTGALSAQQINQYFTAEKSAQARAEAAQALLDAQQLRAKQTQVLAPDSGIISARSATVGAVVGAGTELFRLIRQGRLEWRAEVTSAELDRITVGTRATVQPPSGGALQGRVRMIAPTVDPQTRAALVYVDLPPMSKKVGAALPGMFARGEFDLGASDALTVPQPALIMRDGFQFVFVLGADQRVSQVKVQTGRRVGDRVEVVSGLAPEAQVVVNGAGFLNHGDLVRVVQEFKPNKALSTVLPASAASK
ncbi:efflux RND transporter periplasmic adaptor subunit [Polaromonas sp.]|uniref:efflux RND transporter periplasmic adaptor subunit n=1 Tax=Polaromonas sp. TaxID=1869339 RepID=UPI001DB78A64|nr:efflux RND transporter periplasmic adaptor subunit [Polaromonas sp.]MBT9475415.1 efflux RND transporter periplasmic adaptor subunit [Polaromonas sp.]